MITLSSGSGIGNGNEPQTVSKQYSNLLILLHVGFACAMVTLLTDSMAAAMSACLSDGGFYFCLSSFVYAHFACLNICLPVTHSDLLT